MYVCTTCPHPGGFLHNWPRLLRLLFRMLSLLSCDFLATTATSVFRLRYGLAIDHLGVLANAVALVGRNVILGLLRLVVGWSPGEIVATDFEVVVGELAELVVV